MTGLNEPHVPVEWVGHTPERKRRAEVTGLA